LVDPSHQHGLLTESINLLTHTLRKPKHSIEITYLSQERIDDAIDFRGRFDTKTDRFSIPADLAKNNAETINYHKPKRN
jgi:hypothetical protein